MGLQENKLLRIEYVFGIAVATVSNLKE